MSLSIEQAAVDVFEEAVDEFFGKSKRTWALFLVVFILGGVATAVVAARLRQRRAAGTLRGPDADTAVPPSGPQEAEPRYGNSSKSSSWSRRRAQIARTDAAMRRRVGGTAGRLNIRRHAPAAPEGNS